MKKELFPYVAIFVNILMTCTMTIMGYVLYDIAYAAAAEESAPSFPVAALFGVLLYALLIYQVFSAVGSGH